MARRPSRTPVVEEATVAVTATHGVYDYHDPKEGVEVKTPGIAGYHDPKEGCESKTPGIGPYNDEAGARFRIHIPALAPEPAEEPAVELITEELDRVSKAEQDDEKE